MRRAPPVHTYRTYVPATEPVATIAAAAAVSENMDTGGCDLRNQRSAARRKRLRRGACAASRSRRRRRGRRRRRRGGCGLLPRWSQLQVLVRVRTAAPGAAADAMQPQRRQRQLRRRVYTRPRSVLLGVLVRQRVPRRRLSRTPDDVIATMHRHHEARLEVRREAPGVRRCQVERWPVKLRRSS